MPRDQKPRLTSGVYRALFTPSVPQAEREIIAISEEEEEPMMIEEVAENSSHGMPTPTPVPAPATVPAPAPEPTQAPPPAAPVEEGTGWICTYIYKKAPANAYYHSLLVGMLGEYYPDLHAKVKYYCAEYTHPTEATYWKTEVTVTAWSDARDGKVVDTIHGHTSRRAAVLDSMEDAAQEAYIHYHGRRYEAMKEDRFRYLPRYLESEGDWVITNPEDSYPTLDATARHVHALKMENEDLKVELRDAHRAGRRFQKEIDALRAQLEMPPLYKKRKTKD